MYIYAYIVYKYVYVQIDMLIKPNLPSKGLSILSELLVLLSSLLPSFLFSFVLPPSSPTANSRSQWALPNLNRKIQLAMSIAGA